MLSFSDVKIVRTAMAGSKARAITHDPEKGYQTVPVAFPSEFCSIPKTRTHDNRPIVVS